MRLRDVNLNAFIVLDALMRYKTTTAAAEYLCISQSAVSKQLANLRKITNDPLFQKIGSEFRPTQRAINLHSYTKKALALMDEGLNPTTNFDYSEAERTFVIATTDYFKSIILHRYIDKLFMAAASVKLEVIDLPLNINDRSLVKPAQLFKLLDSGDIDLIIHPDAKSFATPEYDSQLDHKDLISDQWVVAFNDELEINEDEMDRFLSQADHIRIKYPPLENQLTPDIGFSRNIKVELETFSGITEILTNTDCVAIIPEKIARQGRPGSTITTAPLKTRLEPFIHYLIWHENAVNQQDQIFLRQSLLNLCARI